jgi:hypothetical protein
VAVALDQNGGKYAPQIAFLFEFFNQHSAGIGQFLAHQPEKLFAHDFRSEETFAAVGDVVFVEHRRVFRQQLLGLACKASS